MKRRTFLAAAIGTMFRPPLPLPPAPAAAAPTWVAASAGGYMVPPELSPLFTGYIGVVEGFRFIPSTADAREQPSPACRLAKTLALEGFGAGRRFWEGDALILDEVPWRDLYEVRP